MQTIEEDTLTMTVDEGARALGVSRNSVYTSANRGEIPCRRVGRRVIFSRDAIRAWLAGR